MTQLRLMDHLRGPAFPSGNVGFSAVMKRLMSRVSLFSSQRRAARTMVSSASDATPFCRARPNPPNFRAIEPN